MSHVGNYIKQAISMDHVAFDGFGHILCNRKKTIIVMTDNKVVAMSFEGKHILLSIENFCDQMLRCQIF